MSGVFSAPQPGERDRRRPEAFKAVHRVPARPLIRGWFGFGHRRWRAPVLIAHVNPASIAAEAYRTVRTNLEFMKAERPHRNVAVTSPTAGSGKSTTAANLAIAAAQAGSRVCLVDADQRRPVLHEAFGLPNRGGLTAVLKGDVSLHGAARDTAIENLSLVVSGPTGGLPQGLFVSERLQKLFSDAGSYFDLIVYDTPPVLLVADAVNIAALCDGVVLVVRAGSIPPSVLERAVRQIRQVNGRLLGVVLNQVDLRRGDDDVYRYYRAYYGEESGE